MGTTPTHKGVLVAGVPCRQHAFGLAGHKPDACNITRGRVCAFIHRSRCLPSQGGEQPGMMTARHHFSNVCWGHTTHAEAAGIRH